MRTITRAFRALFATHRSVPLEEYTESNEPGECQLQIGQTMPVRKPASCFLAEQ